MRPVSQFAPTELVSYISGMNNQHGHWMVWMSMRRKTGLMWKHTHTLHTLNAQPCCTCCLLLILPETNATAGFSTVYLVRDTRTRDQLALKRMLCQERESTEAAYREVQVLRAVRHRNVVSLLDQVPRPAPLHPIPTSCHVSSRHVTPTCSTSTSSYVFMHVFFPTWRASTFLT